MENAVYLNHFLAMGLAAQNYLLNHILVWNMLLQLIVAGSCIFWLVWRPRRCGPGCAGNWRVTPSLNTLCRT